MLSIFFLYQPQSAHLDVMLFPPIWDNYFCYYYYFLSYQNDTNHLYNTSRNYVHWILNETGMWCEIVLFSKIWVLVNSNCAPWRYGIQSLFFKLVWHVMTKASLHQLWFGYRRWQTFGCDRNHVSNQICNNSASTVSTRHGICAIFRCSHATPEDGTYWSHFSYQLNKNKKIFAERI